MTIQIEPWSALFGALMCCLVGSGGTLALLLFIASRQMAARKHPLVQAKVAKAALPYGAEFRSDRGADE